MFLLSYGNTIFNQSACLFSLACFSNENLVLRRVGANRENHYPTFEDIIFIHMHDILFGTILDPLKWYYDQAFTT